MWQSDIMWHCDTIMTPKVLQFIGPWYDGRRYNRDTYLFVFTACQSRPCNNQYVRTASFLSAAATAAAAIGSWLASELSVRPSTSLCNDPHHHPFLNTWLLHGWSWSSYISRRGLTCIHGAAKKLLCSRSHGMVFLCGLSIRACFCRIMYPAVMLITIIFPSSIQIHLLRQPVLSTDKIREGINQIWSRLDQLNTHTHKKRLTYSPS